MLLSRFGLLPRKKDSNAQLHNILLELNEKKKQATREKHPGKAIMTVDEMGLRAGIARQTMYDHLKRWTSLNILKKSSIVENGAVIIGYELNGPTLESAFRKAETHIHNHLNNSFKVLSQLQQEVKKEKLRKAKTND